MITWRSTGGLCRDLQCGEDMGVHKAVVRILMSTAVRSSAVLSRIWTQVEIAVLWGVVCSVFTTPITTLTAVVGNGCKLKRFARFWSDYNRVIKCMLLSRWVFLVGSVWLVSNRYNWFEE